LKSPIIIKFDGGYLAQLKPCHITDQYISGINDPDVNMYLVTVSSKTQTLETLSTFVIDNEKDPKSILFGIWVGTNKNISGTLRIHGLEDVFKTGHIGICIFDKKMWGKGIGSKAIAAITNWCFEELKLRWIEASTFEHNISSRNSFLKAGYEWVSDIKDKYLLDGKPVTTKTYAAKAPKRD